MKLPLASLLLVLLAVALSTPPSLAGPRSKREAVRARSTPGDGVGSQRVRRVYQNEPRPTQPPRYPTFIQIPKTRKKHTKRQIKEKERYPSFIPLSIPAPDAQVPKKKPRRPIQQGDRYPSFIPYEEKFPRKHAKRQMKWKKHDINSDIPSQAQPIPNERSTRPTPTPEKERHFSFINWNIRTQETKPTENGSPRSVPNGPSFVSMRSNRRKG